MALESTSALKTLDEEISTMIRACGFSSVGITSNLGNAYNVPSIMIGSGRTGEEIAQVSDGTGRNDFLIIHTSPLGTQLIDNGDPATFIGNNREVVGMCAALIAEHLCEKQFWDVVENHGEGAEE